MTLRHIAGSKRLAATLLLALGLTACASLGGAPEPVVGVASSVNLAGRYPIDIALRAFHDDAEVIEVSGERADLRNGLTPQQYRDMVVSVYLGAVDSRYFEFRTALSHERRELGTGFDFAILGLTTGAAVARDSIVNSLSAAASVMTGTRSSLDRNLYFDQTLPGLLAAMEAARLRVLTRITRNLTKTHLEYPLESAFADLRAYEMAASLDGAIGEITAEAADDRAIAQREYNTAVRACRATEDLRPNRRIIANWVLDVATLDQLQEMAGLMQLEVDAPGTDDERKVALQDRLENAVLESYCSNALLESLIAGARSTSWGTGL